MDDDRTLGAMVTALAEPRTPPPDALERIAAAASAAQRRQRLTRGAALAAVVIVAAALVVTVPRLAGPGPTSSGGQRPMSVSDRFHGFNLEMYVVFPTDRLLVKGAYVVDGHSGEIGFYNNDGADETYPSLAIHAGDDVDAYGSVSPSCESGWEWPVAVVTSRLEDGRTITERFEPDAASRQAYQKERDWWCSVPAHAAIIISGHGPKRRVHFEIDIDNTTAHSISVVSAHLSYGETSWPRSSVVVSPRGRARLSVQATGYRGGPKPWDRGLLTVDGVPITLQTEGGATISGSGTP
jgi:hypothetical protein